MGVIGATAHRQKAGPRREIGRRGRRGGVCGKRPAKSPRSLQCGGNTILVERVGRII